MATAQTSSRQPQRQRVPAAERRDALIEAAIHEFAHGGLHGTPVERIATARRRRAALRLQPLREQARAVPGGGRARLPAHRRDVHTRRGRARPGDAAHARERGARRDGQGLHRAARLPPRLPDAPAPGVCRVRRRGDPRPRARLLCASGRARRSLSGADPERIDEFIARACGSTSPRRWASTSSPQTASGSAPRSSSASEARLLQNHRRLPIGFCGS